ncbi:MAG: hypothetical protein ACK52I_13200 [Pseudomonadota bacterium]
MRFRIEKKEARVGHKVKMLIEVDCEDCAFSLDDPASVEWFAQEVLTEDGALYLHSNEVGDTVGRVRVLVVHDWPPRSDTPHEWTDRRCQEIFDLETLLREVGKINNASNVIERIQACIELAEKLSRSSFSDNETSFLGFLNGLAIADRIAQQSANAEKE